MVGECISAVLYNNYDRTNIQCDFVTKLKVDRFILKYKYFYRQKESNYTIVILKMINNQKDQIEIKKIEVTFSYMAILKYDIFILNQRTQRKFCQELLVDWH